MQNIWIKRYVAILTVVILMRLFGVHTWGSSKQNIRRSSVRSEVVLKNDTPARDLLEPEDDDDNNNKNETSPRRITRDKEVYIVHPSTRPARINEQKMYGLIHEAYTGGSSLNGILARKYERVCGNKGSSFQEYHWKSKTTTLEGQSMRNLLLRHTGYQDCDMVLAEEGWTYWTKQFSKWFLPVELHIACRDPLKHLEAKFRYRRHEFVCPSMDLSDKEFHAKLEEELFKVAFDSDNRQGKHTVFRVSSALKLVPNFELKCFDYKHEFTKYLDYMDDRLERKRIESVHVMQHRAVDRNRTLTCIWNQEQAFRDRIVNYLVKGHTNDYYRFCNACLGSEDDLLAESKTQSKDT